MALSSIDGLISTVLFEASLSIVRSIPVCGQQEGEAYPHSCCVQLRDPRINPASTPLATYSVRSTGIGPWDRLRGSSSSDHLQ